MLLLDQSSFIHQIGTWMCQVHQQVQGIQQQKDRWRQHRPKLRQLQALKSLPPQPPLWEQLLCLWLPHPPPTTPPGPALCLFLKYLRGPPSSLASQ